MTYPRFVQAHPSHADAACGWVKMVTTSYVILRIGQAVYIGVYNDEAYNRLIGTGTVAHIPDKKAIQLRHRAAVLRARRDQESIVAEFEGVEQLFKNWPRPNLTPPAPPKLEWMSEAGNPRTSTEWLVFILVIGLVAGLGWVALLIYNLVRLGVAP